MLLHMPDEKSNWSRSTVCRNGIMKRHKKYTSPLSVHAWCIMSYHVDLAYSKKLRDSAKLKEVSKVHT